MTLPLEEIVPVVMADRPTVALLRPWPSRGNGMIQSGARKLDPDMAAPVGYRVSALDIRRSSLFFAVVEHDGFTAPRRWRTFPSPLSQAIGELEAELGGPLFHLGAVALEGMDLARLPERAVARIRAASNGVRVPGFQPDPYAERGGER
jgi:hypothetical protein